MSTSPQLGQDQDRVTLEESLRDPRRKPPAQRASGRRVAVIIEKLPGFGFGGAQSVGFWTVEALREGYQVSVITAAHDLSLAEANAFFGTHIRPDDVEIVVVPMPSVVRDSPRLKLLAMHLIGRYCRETWTDYDLLISTAGEMDLGIRGIQYVHYPLVLPRGRSKRYLVLGLLSRAITGFSRERMVLNWTLTNSKWTAQRTREAYGVDPLVVYPPVPDEVHSLPWSRREDGFVHVGRISTEKNLERVIRIVKKAHERVPELHLHLIGGIRDRRYWNKFKRLMANEKHWLFFEGTLSREDMVKLIGAHKYGIHGMQEEHFGIGIAEMAKSGCLVFVPRGGGQVEIVQAEELVYDGEGDAITKILRVVGSSDRQAALQRVLTDQARQFSSQRFMREMRMVVDRFLAERDSLREASR
jgi:glycosyltransferase involved in cell wall biosynthesis